MLQIPKKVVFSKIEEWSQKEFLPFLVENFSSDLNYEIKKGLEDNALIVIEAQKNTVVFTVLLQAQATNSKVSLPYQKDELFSLQELRFSIQELSMGGEDFYLSEKFSLAQESLDEQEWSKVKNKLMLELSSIHQSFEDFKKEKNNLKKTIVSSTLPIKVKKCLSKKGVKIEIFLKKEESIKKLLEILQEDQKK